MKFTSRKEITVVRNKAPYLEAEQPRVRNEHLSRVVCDRPLRKYTRRQPPGSRRHARGGGVVHAGGGRRACEGIYEALRAASCARSKYGVPELVTPWQVLVQVGIARQNSWHGSCWWSTAEPRWSRWRSRKDLYGV
eukprot:scaffold34755_cov45-Phaeocystis_antarctica.AAC.2